MDRFEGSVCRVLTLVWPCTLALLSARALGQEEEAEPPSPVQISHDQLGNAVLCLDAETQSRIALATTRLQEETLQPEVTAYGIFEEDPGQSFILRSPISGYLRSEDGATWPRIGERVEGGVTVAALEPRLTPTESLDLLTRWMDARAEVDELEAEVQASRSSFENKKRLNEESKVVSDRSMEEAEARLKSSEARLAGVKERVDALERVMPSQGALVRIPVTLSRGGDVVEVTARPDEAVENGQALLRVIQFDVLIARVAAPAGSEVSVPLPQARLTILGKEGLVLLADPVGPAPSTDITTRGETLLFRVTQPPDARFRPGTPVVVHIPTAGAAILGTVVPRSAVLRYGGFAWVYVATSETEFSRRMIELLSPLESGWFVSAGVAPGDSLVTSGAQSLLSEELKAQIESEEAAEE